MRTQLAQQDDPCARRPMGMLPVPRRDMELYSRLRAIAWAAAGLELKEHKTQLVAARVGRRMRELGLSRLEDYVDLLESDDSGHELVRLLDVLTTNVTSFFREPDHFDYLLDLLREWRAAGQHRFRIWSAAAATGEEPYTIAMCVADVDPGFETDTRILATDLSTTALATARTGVYRAKTVATVPPAYRLRYLEPAGRSPRGETLFRIAPSVQRLVTFDRQNLLETPYPMRGPFDAIFCRNVTFYLTPEVRRQLLLEIQRLLRPGGLLFVGHAETLLGPTGALRQVRPSVYRRMEDTTA